MVCRVTRRRSSLTNDEFLALLHVRCNLSKDLIDFLLGVYKETERCAAIVVTRLWLHGDKGLGDCGVCTLEMT